jgi:hypothetical protein
MKKPKQKISHKKNQTNKIYFSKETEEAIIRYNDADDMDVRENIFKMYIDRPLDKLAENIINRFHFSYMEQSFEETKQQVVSFLVTNLWRYTQDKGKAFSYFSVIAKNYLILHNNLGYKEQKQSVSLTEPIQDSHIPIEDVITLEAPDAHQHEDIKEFTELFIDYWDEHTSKIFKKKRDREIAYAVIELFRHVDGIESYNKKHLYLLIREIADCKTTYITKVINKMKFHVKRQMIEFYDQGIIKK